MRVKTIEDKMVSIILTKLMNLNQFKFLKDSSHKNLNQWAISLNNKFEYELYQYNWNNMYLHVEYFILNLCTIILKCIRSNSLTMIVGYIILKCIRSISLAMIVGYIGSL
jgi:hypothetical protein